MPVHLGRIRVITRRKEGKCTHKNCPEDKRVAPGQQVVVLSKGGRVNDKPMVFYKLFHTYCFGPWLEWRCGEIPVSKSGRKVMELSSEDKAHRAKLIRTRARLTRNLRRERNPDKLTVLVERITDLDSLIRDTGYPVLSYQGRRSEVTLRYNKFLQDVKAFYQHPLRVPPDMFEQARNIGKEDEFRKDMDRWQEEVDRVVKERTEQYPDSETGEEDKEE